MKPEIGTGTRIELISFLPLPVVPVTAVTVTSRVSVVPELVMKALLPSMRHAPSWSTAVVRVPPASLPAPGSVRPKAPRAAPLASRGTHCSFCAWVPKRYTGMAPSETPASSVIATDWSTRASSSSTRHSAK